MTDLLVHPATRPLVGSVSAPSDASIGHLALVLAACGDGQTRISGFSRAGDTLVTMQCLRDLGIAIEEPSRGEILVKGAGLYGWRAPDDPLDCAASSATLRLLVGPLAGQRFSSVLVGGSPDSPLALMDLATALRARGARIDGLPDPTRKDDTTVPLTVGRMHEARPLTGIEYASGISSTQLKAAVLMSGLAADGVTHYSEPTVSADHTERLLAALGAPLRTAGPVIELDPTRWDGRIPAFDLSLPGDISAAGYVLAASQLVAGSRVTIRRVGINPTRSGLLEIVRDMDGGLGVEPQGDSSGEPVADLHGWPKPLRAIPVGGETIARAVEEMPIVCALAARAHGTTRLRAVGGLRDEAVDRLAKLASALRLFGVACDARDDGIDVVGSDLPLQAAEVDGFGDPALAMTFVVLALVANGPTRVRRAQSIARVYPKFVATLRALGARVDVQN